LFAYYTVIEFHWKPSEFVNLEINEKAAVIAFIEHKLKEEKKAAKRAKQK
jgi:hypothetical protein